MLSNIIQIQFRKSYKNGSNQTTEYLVFNVFVNLTQYAIIADKYANLTKRNGLTKMNYLLKITRKALIVFVPISLVFLLSCGGVPKKHSPNLTEGTEKLSNNNLLLIEGAHFGDLKLIRKALKDGADIHWKKDGLSSVHQTVLFDNHKALLLLIESGANVNQEESERGLVPLNYAINKQNLKIVRTLISAGATNKKIDGGFTPMEMAFTIGNKLIIKELLKAKFNVSFSFYDSAGETPLMSAILLGDSELFDLLLENGADINARDHKEYTALHIAIMKKDVYMTKKLIDAGADLQAVDFKGRSIKDMLFLRGFMHLLES